MGKVILEKENYMCKYQEVETVLGIFEAGVTGSEKGGGAGGESGRS